MAQLHPVGVQTSLHVDLGLCASLGQHVHQNQPWTAMKRGWTGGNTWDESSSQCWFSSLTLSRPKNFHWIAEMNLGFPLCQGKASFPNAHFPSREISRTQKLVLHTHKFGLCRPSHRPTHSLWFPCRDCICWWSRRHDEDTRTTKHVLYQMKPSNGLVRHASSCKQHHGFFELHFLRSHWRECMQLDSKPICCLGLAWTVSFATWTMVGSLSQRNCTLL